MGDKTPDKKERNITVFDIPGIYIFPRYRADLFNLVEYLPKTDGIVRKIVDVKRNEALDNFEIYNEELGDNIKKRETFVFDNNSQKLSKYITVCIADKRQEGGFCSISNIPPNKPDILKNYYVKMLVENNKTGMDITIHRLEQRGYQEFDTEKGELMSVYSGMGENLWKEILIEIKKKENQKKNDEEKTFEIVAQLLQQDNKNKG